jgi:hypothetical protein
LLDSLLTICLHADVHHLLQWVRHAVATKRHLRAAQADAGAGKAGMQRRTSLTPHPPTYFLFKKKRKEFASVWSSFSMENV